MSTKVALSVGVEAGTMIDAATVARRIGNGQLGVVVGPGVEDVHLVEGAGARRRRDLGNELVAVADVDVLFRVTL